MSSSNSTNLTAARAGASGFIVSELISTDGAPSRSRAEEDLIKRGIVDSLGVMQLVDFCESRYGIRVTDADLVPAELPDRAQTRGLRRAQAGRARKSAEIPVAKPLSSPRPRVCDVGGRMLTDDLYANAEARGSQTALIYGDERLSYAELLDRVERLAHGLAAQRLERR